MYQNIASLLSFFECESYYLRQSLIKILANIIISVLSAKPQDLMGGGSDAMEDIDDEAAINAKRE